MKRIAIRCCAVCGGEIMRALPRTAQLGMDDSFVPVCDRCYRATPSELRGELRVIRLVRRARRPGLLAPSKSATPSAEILYRLRRAIAAKIPKRSNDYTPEGMGRRERAISLRFAAALRRRGWLTPDREGYAPGSWADPANRRARRNG